jgi:Spy/CpxP family protein refolding chaperone
MKTSLLSLLFVGAALTALPAQMAWADDSTTSGQASTPSGTTNSGGSGPQAQRIERIKEAFAQLDLTDAQKEQIRQIRTTVTDRKERFEAILNVLTPDQKAKLREFIEAHRNGAQSGASTASTSNGN